MASFDPNPLKELLLDEGASLMPYGVDAPEPGTVRAERAEPSPDVPLLAAAFGPIELEYASLRRDCVIIDRPDRAVIEVTGTDAREFLGRMLTQDVGSLEPGQSCNSFWLNRKGRIDADVRVLRLWEFDNSKPPRFFLDLERGSVDLTLKTLGAYVITEEVTLTPRHDLHRLSLHGPRARDLMLAASESIANISNLKPNANVWDELGDGLGCWIDQHDTCGVPGYEIYAEREVVLWQFRVLLQAGRPDFMTDARASDDPGTHGEALAASKQTREPTAPTTSFERPPPASIRLRPAGWFAYNIARIEAGTPLFKIDFGPDNLPAETGVLHDRVNFKKGCYLGQEVVARMHARGHPKQQLVALRFDDDLPPGPDGLLPLPVQGDRVFAAASASAPTQAPDGSTPAPPAEPKPIGSITSSTFSPMLGRIPIAFAMVAWAHIAPGTRVEVETDNRRIGGVVQDGLRFVP